MTSFTERSRLSETSVNQNFPIDIAYNCSSEGVYSQIIENKVRKVFSHVCTNTSLNNLPRGTYTNQYVGKVLK